jgi:phosphatidylinositol 3-kinase
MEVRIKEFFRNKKIFIFILFSWNEWLTLPLRYCDLPRHAILTFSIHELISPTDIRIIGSTTISLFASDG